jgi:1,4-dihydroxy-2-naphthoate octaprenyltransferase
MNDKTSFLRALRPFSLIVGVATCGLGVSLALLDGADDYVMATLVILTGVLLQVAVNLINDQRDINREQYDAKQRAAIRRNTVVGYLVMLLAILSGLYMVSVVGWPLLLLGVVGIFGAWGYTGGRINYKSRGLGLPLVFLFMGVLMVGGAYYVVARDYHWDVLWLSLPFSLITSLLLLSNELRDFEKDMAEGIGTLSVRIGYMRAVRLYYGLVTLVYLSSALLFQAGLLRFPLLLLVTLLALWQPLKLLKVPAEQRARLAPLTGRYYFIFSIAYLITLWLPPL